MKKLITNLLKNRILLFILITIFALGSYFTLKILSKKETPQYLIGQAKIGNIQKTVSGSGSITIEDQVDIKSKVGGEVIYVTVKNNSQVQAGTILAEIDTTNYRKQVEDAEFSLEMARLTLEKLLSQKEQAINDLNKAYEDTFQHFSTIYGALPDLITNLKNLFDTKSSGNETQLKDLDFYNRIVSFYRNLPYVDNQQYNAFYSLLEDYYKLFRQYQLLKLPLNQEEFDKFINDSHYLVKNLFELVRINRDNVSSYKDLYDNHSISTGISISITESQLTSLQTAVSNLNQYLNTIVSDKNTIDKYKTSIKNYNQDIANQEYTIKQKTNALREAKDNLNNCYIRAPFSGIITNINIKKGDLISANTIIGTLITENKLAEITLSEIDAALVKEGQEAVLTLDALPNISFRGKVIEVGLIGQISQGVVSYPVKISFFPSKDLEKIKAGMTVDANIVYEEKTNVLTVPVSAIKTRMNKYYVEVPQEADIEIIKSHSVINQRQRKAVTLKLPPKEQEVEVGISDDNYYEIVSGLKEGDYIVIEKVSSQKTPPITSRRNSLFTPQIRMPTGGMPIR